ncbi:MAG: HEAT repeat domain-containing protein [Proteobacteria bacterium]|nr:HEAT repeat domain-containing protein [Pseudomonadota bacterium]
MPYPDLTQRPPSLRRYTPFQRYWLWVTAAGIYLVAALAGQPLWGEEPDEAAVRNLVDVLTGSGSTGQDRAAAIRRLEQRRVPPDAAVPALIPLLDDPSFDTRSYAARAWKIFGPNAAPAAPALARRLDDPTRNVRFYVAETLVAIGPRAAPAVTALGRAVGDPASGIQQIAAKALAAIGPAARDAVPGLIAALDSKWREVRWAAARALAAVGPGAAEAVPALAKALRDRETGVSQTAARALGAIGAAAVPALVAALDDPDQFVRVRAISALADMGPAGQGAIQALQRTAETDDKPSVRGVAVRALGKVDPDRERALERLLTLSEDLNYDVRRASIQAIADFGPRFVPTLLDSAVEDDRYLNNQLLRSITSLGSDLDGAFSQIQLLNADTRGPKELAALGAIAAMGPAAVPALRHAAVGDREPIRFRAVSLLGSIAKTAKEIDVSTYLLLRALKDESPRIRYKALEFIKNIKPPPPAGLGLVATLLDDSVLMVRVTALDTLQAYGPEAAPVALPRILAMANDSEFMVRMMVLATLARLGAGTDDAVSLAVAATADRNTLVRLSAVQALGDLGPVRDDIVPTLLKLLGDPEPEVREKAVNALGKIGPRDGRAIPAIANNLQDRASRVRERAAVHLRLIGAPAASALPQLIAALSDEDNFVRYEAAEAVVVGHAPTSGPRTHRIDA